MFSLNINPTKSSPYVRFDPDACDFVIQGESYPENAAAFYEPVLTRIGQWLKVSDRKELNVEFELRYYNSSTSKAIMNLLDLLQAASENGWDIDVSWRFHAENEIIKESGEEFQEDYDLLDIRLIVIPMQG